MNYLERFLRLKCSADVLSILSPFSSGYTKEISEAMCIFGNLKNEIINNKVEQKYNVVELCAGNPLISTLLSFTLHKQIEHCTAIDKKKIVRNYERINNFEYFEHDIYDSLVFKYINSNTIIIAIHSCGELSKRIIEIYNKSDARYLFLMPCCEGKMEFKNKYFLKEKLGRYITWCIYLSDLCGGKVKQDNYVISPKNGLIMAKK